MARIIASLEQASKVYQSGDTEIVALQPTDLEIRAGELILIIGPSGSGKTTLLSLLGCVIYPTQGRVNINGTYTSALNENELAKLRLQEIGFVFQSINLISPLTGLENVMLPLQLSKTAKTETRERAEAALTAVNMADRQHFLPKELSGGQQQRVAIARALVTNPELILCDEPTAALDATSAEVIMQELKQLARQNKAVAVVTHDKRLEAYADRIIKVENGFVIP
ncbi:ABC transporter ATP-binding protein [Adhaeribacter terrigena]|uniref:ABC transporter ATP-binding protein n=1 Tax=Adhaeribacter terrigena TaxID=2793070 RepID=UPI001F1EDEFE|nr:ABC transporter ATP-binding protein [Adhaeribacter terrigena]